MASTIGFKKKMSDNLNLTKINWNESVARHYKLITKRLVALINAADTLPAIIVVILTRLMQLASVGRSACDYYCNLWTSLFPPFREASDNSFSEQLNRPN